ncbi:hypothetical protein LAZ30_15410 [Vibrio alginolyticus]|nr:hypothetical protein [Vibrio alginolyticus]
MSKSLAHPLLTLGFQQTLNIIHNHNTNLKVRRIDFADLLDYLSMDGNTEAILLYLALVKSV